MLRMFVITVVGILQYDCCANALKNKLLNQLMPVWHYGPAARERCIVYTKKDPAGRRGLFYLIIIVYINLFGLTTTSAAATTCATAAKSAATATTWAAESATATVAEATAWRRVGEAAVLLWCTAFETATGRLREAVRLTALEAAV